MDSMGKQSLYAMVRITPNCRTAHVLMSTHVGPTVVLCRTATDRAEPAQRSHMQHKSLVYSGGDCSLLLLSSECNVSCPGCKTVNKKGLDIFPAVLQSPLPPFLLYGPQICHWTQEGKSSKITCPLSHSMIISFRYWDSLLWGWHLMMLNLSPCSLP